MANRMILNETAWFGRGAINALTDEAVRRGYRKALIVTDSTLARCGVAAKVTDKTGCRRAGMGYIQRRDP